MHRRHYDVSLRADLLFQFTKLAKVQQKLLNVVHSLTENVIQKKWEDFEKSEKSEVRDDQITAKKSTKNTEDKTTNYTKLHYAKDDLDDIDENDVGEKKRLAFLEALMNMKRNGGRMTDKEIWEEVNTIMFEVDLNLINV